MNLLILFSLVFWFVGILKAGFDYVNDLHEKELKAIEEKKSFNKDKALKIECRKVRKVLNPDGSVNTAAAKAYLKRQQEREKQGAQYIEFIEVN